MALMTIDEAIHTLRNDPNHADLVREAYLGPDVQDSAARFMATGEFAQLMVLLGSRLVGGRVVDVGAGTGIASYAFAKSGAAHVWAIEPDTSGEVGRGAMARLVAGLPVDIINSFGEQMALPDACADIVYARQVLHHAHDLDAVLRECHRVLKPGGMFIACREHVANTPEELTAFLASHPVHQLAGGEHAFSLSQYLHAIQSAGLTLQHVYRPLESVINAFPAIATEAERQRIPRTRLEAKFGPLGALLAAVPWAQQKIWDKLSRTLPLGAMHTFVAIKP